ncbi:hypothetical protein D3C81_1630550 [compost metagenome]
MDRSVGGGKGFACSWRQAGGDLYNLRRNSLAHDQCPSGCYGETDYRNALIGKTDSDQAAKTISDVLWASAKAQGA